MVKEPTKLIFKNFVISSDFWYLQFEDKFF